MKQTCLNAYALQAWINLIVDAQLEPYIVIDPTRTKRAISVPMDYCVDGNLILNISTQAVGYFNIEKSTGYLMMSSRFNRIDQQMEIPIESIVLTKSSCNKIILENQKELVIISDKKVVANDPIPLVKVEKGIKRGSFLSLVASSATLKPKLSNTGKPNLRLV